MSEQQLKTLDLDVLCQRACQISREAGLKILEIYNGDYTIEKKADHTPVTSADMQADELICRQLQLLTPDIPILSEEATKIPYAIRASWQRYWLVDPLDGTREFIKHNDEFTVNIALIEHGKSILGVIYVPVSCDLYYAYKNHGAYKIEGTASAQQIHTRKLSSKPVIAGSRSHANDKLQAYLDKLGDIELLSIGSSLKSCLVAEGKIDLYPRLGLPRNGIPGRLSA